MQFKILLIIYVHILNLYFESYIYMNFEFKIVIYTKYANIFCLFAIKFIFRVVFAFLSDSIYVVLSDTQYHDDEFLA